MGRKEKPQTEHPFQLGGGELSCESSESRALVPRQQVVQKASPEAGGSGSKCATLGALCGLSSLKSSPSVKDSLTRLCMCLAC